MLLKALLECQTINIDIHFITQAPALKGNLESPSLLTSPTQFLLFYAFPVLPGNHYLPHIGKESQPPIAHFFKNEYFYLFLVPTWERQNYGDR